MRAFLLLLGLFAAPAAHAKNVVLMVNFNYAQGEYDRLKEVAKSRGQEILMIPPQEMLPLGEKLFQLRGELEEKLKAAKPGLKNLQYASMISEIMRKGTEWQEHPDLAREFREDIAELHRRAREVEEKEKSFGPVAQQIERVARELKTSGRKIDTFVMSGHSDGSNLSGETSTRLSASDIMRLEHSSPNLFSDPRHVLLLGCYNMTKTNHARWRHQLFRNATLIAGFGMRAPSRYKKIAKDYISQVLNKADDLDQEMLAKGSALDKEYIISAFKALAAVTGTQSVLDYCVNLFEGQEGASKIPCGKQWELLKLKYQEIVEQYLSLTAPQREPPDETEASDEQKALAIREGPEAIVDDHDNPLVLRAFYNMIQETCPAGENSLFDREQARQMERNRTSILESTIRIMNWSHVQRNFGTYYREHINRFDISLQRLGMKGFAPLDGRASRRDFVARYNELETILPAELDAAEAELASLPRHGARRERQELEDRVRRLNYAIDSFTMFLPLYSLEGEKSVGDPEGSAESTLANGGIPFNWHEPSAVLSPRPL
jgi:hypothetical protein